MQHFETVDDGATAVLRTWPHLPASIRNAILHLTTIDGPLVFDLPLTREAMADYLGLTLETVSRQISALKKDKVIMLEGKRHVTVPDMGRLMEEAGDDADGGLLA